MERTITTMIEQRRIGILTGASFEGVAAIILTIAFPIALNYCVNSLVPAVPYLKPELIVLPFIAGAVVSLAKSAYFITTFWQARRELSMDSELGNKYAAQLFLILNEQKQAVNIPAMIGIVVRKLVKDRDFQGFSKLRYYHSIHNNFTTIFRTITGIAIAALLSFIPRSPSRNALSLAESVQLIWPMLLTAILVADSFRFSEKMFEIILETALLDFLLQDYAG
ncbi:hypothetical protein KDL29_08860 [bacterium]|nr:hypothetical protein [bacterium]